jgi:flagellar basal body-associated protein FliL
MSTTLLIVLIAVVLAVGIGAVVWNRSRSATPTTTRPSAPAARPLV